MLSEISNTIAERTTVVERNDVIGVKFCWTCNTVYDQNFRKIADHTSKKQEKETTIADQSSKQEKETKSKIPKLAQKENGRQPDPIEEIADQTSKKQEKETTIADQSSKQEKETKIPDQSCEQQQETNAPQADGAKIKDLDGLFEALKAHMEQSTSTNKMAYVNAIDTALKPLEGKISALFEQGQENKVVVDGLKKDLCGVRSEMNQVSKTTSTIKKDFAMFKDDVAESKLAVDKLTQTIGNMEPKVQKALDKLVKLDERLGALEMSNGAIEGRLEAQAAEVASHAAHTAELRSAFDQLRTQHEVLVSDHNTLESKTAHDIEQLNQRMDNAQRAQEEAAAGNQQPGTMDQTMEDRIKVAVAQALDAREEDFKKVVDARVQQGIEDHKRAIHHQQTRSRQCLRKALWLSALMFFASLLLGMAVFASSNAADRTVAAFLRALDETPWNISNLFAAPPLPLLWWEQAQNSIYAYVGQVPVKPKPLTFSSMWVGASDSGISLATSLLAYFGPSSAAANTVVAPADGLSFLKVRYKMTRSLYGRSAQSANPVNSPQGIKTMKLASLFKKEWIVNILRPGHGKHPTRIAADATAKIEDVVDLKRLRTLTWTTNHVLCAWSWVTKHAARAWTWISLVGQLNIVAQANRAPLERYGLGWAAKHCGSGKPSTSRTLRGEKKYGRDGHGGWDRTGGVAMADRVGVHKEPRDGGSKGCTANSKMRCSRRPRRKKSLDSMKVTVTAL
ncbi:hypothetical protein CBOM_00551 [Ceraceosorus bombacis]|uniref:Uncharacterized protein n=1 Tax=Ceraceosorus bombacis TaxID=401625 RepID=A0A0P1BA26_9BASI|nr:hypothetical protein CBOM_00551 [Ceraceosorus bombacis]